MFRFLTGAVFVAASATARLIYHNPIGMSTTFSNYLSTSFPHCFHNLFHYIHTPENPSTQKKPEARALVDLGPRGKNLSYIGEYPRSWSHSVMGSGSVWPGFQEDGPLRPAMQAADFPPSLRQYISHAILANSRFCFKSSQGDASPGSYMNKL